MRHRSGLLQEKVGGAIIALLVVLAIIFALIMLGPFSRDTETQVTQSQTYIDRSADVACAANRNAIKTNLTNLRMMNPGMPMDIELIKRRIPIPPCPGHGAYLIGPDGEVYCTKHFPPPAEMLEKMVTLSDPALQATPGPEAAASPAAGAPPPPNP